MVLLTSWPHTLSDFSEFDYARFTAWTAKTYLPPFPIGSNFSGY